MAACPLAPRVRIGDQQLYRGEAISLRYGSNGAIVKFGRKDLEVTEIYEDCVVVEALDGQQFQMTIEEWVGSAERGRS